MWSKNELSIFVEVVWTLDHSVSQVDIRISWRLSNLYHCGTTCIIVVQNFFVVYIYSNLLTWNTLSLKCVQSMIRMVRITKMLSYSCIVLKLYIVIWRSGSYFESNLNQLSTVLRKHAWVKVQRSIINSPQALFIYVIHEY